jgi:hypothetical protein
MPNLGARDPDAIIADHDYIVCIRRANLDAMNARAGDTIKGHVDHLLATEARCRDINRTPNFPQRGPFLLADPVGMGCAVDIHAVQISHNQRESSGSHPV